MLTKCTERPLGTNIVVLQIIRLFEVAALFVD